MHDERHYPEPYKFDPDRFIDERVQKYLVPNPFIFLPFNAGPRICLGQQVRRYSSTYGEALVVLPLLRHPIILRSSC